MLTAKSWRIFCVAATYLSYLLSGSCINLNGPALLHLEYLFSTDTKHIGFSFVAYCTGFAGSAILCGFLYARLNKELQLSFVTFGFGFVTILLPWQPSVYYFIASVALQAAFVGYFYTAANAYVLWLCRDSKLKRPVVTGLHALGSSGAALGPLMLRPFLVKLPSSADQNTGDSVDNSHAFNVSAYADDKNESDSIESNYTANTFRNERVTDVDVFVIRYGYLLAGLLCILPGVMFVIAFLGKKENESQLNIKHKNDANTANSMNIEPVLSPCVKRILLAFLLSIVFAEQAYSTGIPRGYLAAFAVKGLSWSAKDAALLASVFWLVHGASRVIGVVTSSFFTPTSITFVNLLFAFSGYVVMMFLPNLPSSVTWIACVLSAFGAGTMFSMMLLFFSDYVTMSGRVTSAVFVMVSASFGCSGAVMGFLFQVYDPMYYTYICISAVLLHFVLFSIAVWIGKNWLNKQGNNAGINMEIACQQGEVKEGLVSISLIEKASNKPSINIDGHALSS